MRSEMQTTLILVTLLTIGIAFGNKTEKGCGNNPADIVFVLDESSSIFGPDFKRQLDFVQNTIETFDVGFKRTHIGVLTFATEIRVIFHLGNYTEEAELKNAVKAIRQESGDTSTHLALKRLREEMFSPQYTRSWVRHVAIVITDGESNYPEKTEKEARLCHKAGLQVFAIGVGRSVAQKELEAIASAPDLVFKVDSYEALDTLRQILAWKACEPRAPPCPPTTNTTEGLSQMSEVNGFGMTTTIILVIATGLLGFIIGIFVAAAALKNWSRNVTADPITSKNCQVVLSPDHGEERNRPAVVDNYWHIMPEDITTPSVYSELHHPTIESHEVCSYENESEEVPHYDDVLFTMPSSNAEEEIVCLPMEDGQAPNDDYLEVIT